jgi:uncharacterized protein (TIGR03382 family)
MPRKAVVVVVVVVVGCFLNPTNTHAQPRLIPGPTEPDHDTALAAKAAAYDLQVHQFMTLPVGWGLEAYVDDPGARAAIDAFFASGATDFRTQSGRHPYEVISFYEEMGDLGMFGGVQAAGDAFQYAVLRDSGAPAAEVDRARANLLRAMDGLHWYHQITGVPGVVARGLFRITPEAGEPPIPGERFSTTPLFDGSGNPLPADKRAVWRDDQSGALPFLIWMDDTSKDQLDGYIFALGVVWDLTVDDPTIPREKIDALVEDARAIGLSLMERREIARGRFTDLVIMDADGRFTTFHDLSAEEVTPGLILDRPTNGFNGWMALGIIRTIYAMTGDERIGRYYYEELLGARDYLSNAQGTIRGMYLGEQTNFSNVNMAVVAAYGLLRYETDRRTAMRVREIFEQEIYSPGTPDMEVDRAAQGLGQSFFDLMFAGFRTAGLFGDGTTARDEGLVTLRAFRSPPYWDDAVINCDEAEIAALSCLAIDGTTVIALSPDPSRGGGITAVDGIPKALRPPSNFEWRSDPHSPNGGGGNRLNPGGDFHAAYWMGRYLQAGMDGMANVSPHGRDPFPIPPPPDGGPRAPDAGPGGGGDDGGGCGCGTTHANGTAAPLLLALLLLRGRRKR